MATPLATELDREAANNEFLAASLDWLEPGLTGPAEGRAGP